MTLTKPDTRPNTYCPGCQTTVISTPQGKCGWCGDALSFAPEPVEYSMEVATASVLIMNASSNK